MLKNKSKFDEKNTWFYGRLTTFQNAFVSDVPLYRCPRNACQNKSVVGDDE
jgi:hypothetical protein